MHRAFPPRPLPLQQLLAVSLLLSLAPRSLATAAADPPPPTPPPRAAESPPLLAACAARDEPRALALLANASFEEVNARNAFGDSALIWACKNGLARAALALVRAGADVHTRAASGDTPLTWSAFSGLDEVVRELLARGADVDAVVRGEALALTALAHAAREGHAAIALALLERGADANGGRGVAADGVTPLVFAIERGLAEIVPALLAKGARADAPIAGRGGATPEALCRARAAAGDAAMARQCDAVRAAAWAPRRLAACERMLAACVRGSAEAALAELGALREGPGVRAGARAPGGAGGPAVMEIVRVDCQGSPHVRDALLAALLAGEEDPRVTWLERIWWWRGWRPPVARGDEM
jgi:ankyrin repeat protein